MFFPANQMEWWSPIMSLGSKISPLWWHEQCSGGTHSPASLRKSPLGQKQPSSHKSLQSPSGSDRARHVWLHTLPHTPYTWSSGQVSSAQTHTHTFGLLSWWRPSIDFCYVNLYAFLVCLFSCFAVLLYCIKCLSYSVFLSCFPVQISKHS